MCGICGVKGQSSKSLINSMLQAISHRGPDTFDVLVTEKASLGGCRLRIVGDIAYPLPIIDQNKAMLLFNGEIYNYLALKSELEKEGLGFDKGCESEILLNLLKKEGAEAAKRLRGMFAFAYLDDEMLMLGRDRYGIKPLFYTEIGQEIVFASEIKAILRHPGIMPILDEDVLRQIVVFGYIVSDDRTIFKNIKQVPPGTVITFGPKGKEQYKYFSPSPAFSLNGENVDYMEQVELLRQAISSSVLEMMSHGEQPKGFYLSGGLDSSLLALLASIDADHKIHTFTLADSTESDDSKAARKVAHAIGSEHNEYLVDADDYLKELPAFVYHYENAIAGGVFDIHGGMAFQMLSRRVAEQVKVAFSGEGADELFGGYYWAYTHPLGFADRIKNRLRSIRDKGEVAGIVDSLFPEPEDFASYQRNLFDFLLGSGLSNYHLWSVDRSCGAFGFEIRPAYLSEEISDFALGLPIDYKCNRESTKIILRDVARPLFERAGIEESLTRLKLGMPAAVQNIATEIDSLAEGMMPAVKLAEHPFSQYLTNSLEAIMFDIFFYIFFENHGKKIDDFDVKQFYKEGINARMYA